MRMDSSMYAHDLLFTVDYRTLYQQVNSVDQEKTRVMGRPWCVAV
jgi:hypothetical protein